MLYAGYIANIHTEICITKYFIIKLIVMGWDKPIGILTRLFPSVIVFSGTRQDVTKFITYNVMDIIVCNATRDVNYFVFDVSKRIDVSEWQNLNHHFILHSFIFVPGARRWKSAK
jgi:hypothetical protein